MPQLIQNFAFLIAVRGPTVTRMQRCGMPDFHAQASIAYHDSPNGRFAPSLAFSAVDTIVP